MKIDDQDQIREVVPVMLTIKQEAEKTGLSYDCIRKLCLTNQIVYFRAGNKYFINHEKFLAFLNGGSANE